MRIQSTGSSAETIRDHPVTEQAAPKMKTWAVTLPIAGHAYLIVEALDEASAIDDALGRVELQHIETWEAITRFHQGNVCYCPHPWEAEAVDETPDDETNL